MPPRKPDLSFMSDGNMIDHFNAYQRLRGWSGTTIKRRTTTLRALATFSAPAGLARVDGDMVADFLAQYRSPRTRAAYLSDLRVFFRWAVRRHAIDADPMLLIDPVKVPRCLPRPVPTDDVRAAIDAATGDLRLMVALAAYAGLRCCEIAALGRDDCAGGRLVVRSGKGGKDRTIPLHPMLAAMVATYPTGPLFPNRSANRVSRLISVHLSECGINATAHQLRHSFGTELARVTSGDLLLIATLMGHADTTTTLGYTALGVGRGADAVGGLYAA